VPSVELWWSCFALVPQNPGDRAPERESLKLEAAKSLWEQSLEDKPVVTSGKDGEGIHPISLL